MALVGLRQELLAAGCGGGRARGGFQLSPPGAIISAPCPKTGRRGGFGVFSGGQPGLGAQPAADGAASRRQGCAAPPCWRHWGWPPGFCRAAIAQLPGAVQPHEQRAGHSTVHGAARQGSMLALVLMTLYVGVRSWFQGGFVTYLPNGCTAAGKAWKPPVAASTMMIVMSVGSFGAAPSLTGWAHARAAGQHGVDDSVHLAGAAPHRPCAGGGRRAAGLCSGVSFPASFLMAQEAWPSGTGLASAMVMGSGWLPYGFGRWGGLLADRPTLSSALNTLVWVPWRGCGRIDLLLGPATTEERLKPYHNRV